MHPEKGNKMNKNLVGVILYPLLSDGMQLAQKKSAFLYLKDYGEDSIASAMEKRLLPDELKKILDEMGEEEKLNSFKMAKLIGGTSITLEQIKGYADLGVMMGISSDDTGFDFDLYDPDGVMEWEFHRSLTRFSSIAAAVGFIPMPFPDIFLLSPLQLGLIAKISNLYEYHIDAKELLKLVAGALGSGLIFKLTSMLLNKLIPVIGWVINAGVAYAGTYAIGIVTRQYIEKKGKLTGENIAKIFEDSFTDGKKEFNILKKELLSKKDELMSQFKEHFQKNDNTETEEPSETEYQEPPVKKETRKKTVKKNDTKSADTNQ